MRLYFSLLFSLCLYIAAGCGNQHAEDPDHDHDHDHDHDEEKHNAEGIRLSDHQMTEFGIEFETVTPSEFFDVIRTSGEIDTSNSDIFKVTAKRSGIITLSPGIETGSKVNAGQRIASISSAGVQGGDVNKAAEANLKAAEAEYERLKPLYDEGLVTASTFREAERAYNEAKALSAMPGSGGVQVLSSPSEGTILDLYVKSGEFLNVGDPVATVGKNVNLTLKADLPLKDSKHLNDIETANFIPEGSNEILKLQDLNGRKISGAANNGASKGYIPVYFSFTGNNLSAPGGYAEVFLICGKRNNVISVPRDALVELQGNRYAYVKDEHSGLKKVLVKTGATDGERIEILSGLEAGDTIVSKGASIVRMAEISSVAPPSHTHNH